MLQAWMDSLKHLNKSHKKNLSDDLPVNSYVFPTDKSDLRIFKDILDENEIIAKTNELGRELFPTFGELHQDLFNSFFKYKPITNPESTMDMKYLMNHKIVTELMELNKFKELRALTRHDPIVSAGATQHMGEDVCKLIEKIQKENPELQEMMDKLSKQSQPGEGEEGEEGEGGNQMTPEEAERLLEEYKKKLHDVIHQQEKPALTHMMEKALASANETQGMIQNWGLGQDEFYSRSNYGEKIKLLDRLRSAKLQEIAKLVGRYKRLATQSQREKTKKGLNETHNVIIGKTLESVLPSEFMKLVNPETEDIFYKDYTESKLLMYEYKTKEKKQKGPILICIDNSGSMSGQPEIFDF